MSDELTKLAYKIKKLLAKAESADALGSQEEAAAFAAKAKQLMDEHKLSLSDVEFAKLQTEEPIEEGDRVNIVHPKKGDELWIRSLARIVAEAHQCKSLIPTKANHEGVWFVGRKSDRQVAEYVFTVLARTCIEVGQKENRKARRHARHNLGNVSLARGFWPSFRSGFLQEIQKRYREETQKLTQEQRGVAMIRLSGVDVQKWIDDQGQKYKTPAQQRKPKATDFNELGFKLGKETGANVSIRGNAMDSGIKPKELK